MDQVTKIGLIARCPQVVYDCDLAERTIPSEKVKGQYTDIRAWQVSGQDVPQLQAMSLDADHD